MTTLVASDLDRTLIYSATAAGGAPDPRVTVERYLDEPASFMTRTAAERWAVLTDRIPVVPVTTRTPEQFARVVLPGRTPRFAVTANGGVLLVDGVPDGAWTKRVRRTLTDVAPLPVVHGPMSVACAPFTRSVRTAAGLFGYAVVRREELPDGLVSDLSERAELHGWRVSLQGRKLYWVPRPLRKSDAVAEVAGRCGADTVLAAGDSLLDVDLLLAADRGVHPAHGELFQQGWRAPSVQRTAAAGIRAGEEIVTWFAAHCAPGAVAQQLL